MGYLNFPSDLTEEEQMLQEKYIKLKKKKKALLALKAPKKEVEKPLMLQQLIDAGNSREVACMLLRTGFISPIIKEPSKHDQTSFKRPKGQERRRTAPETTVTAYNPFSSTQNLVASGIIKEKPRAHFSKERDREKRGLNVDKSALESTQPEKPQAGNTIFVSGDKVTKEFLRKTFNYCGTIVNVSMGIEWGQGFVTFAEPKSADRAIAEMHSKNVNGNNLIVQLARHQLKAELINEASAAIEWSTLAGSRSQRSSHKDNRDIVQYEDFPL